MQTTIPDAIEARDTTLSRSLIASESPSSLAFHAFLRHRSGMVGLTITLLLILVALSAPLLAPYDALAIDASARFVPPSPAHPFGTDEFGRDLFSRVIMGSRISLSVGFVAIGIAALLGITTGLTAGYAGGWFDSIMMRFYDALLAFPAILLAIVILAVLGPGGLPAMLAIAVVSVPAFARLTRANVLVEKSKEYVQAARSVGAKPGRIAFGSIFPNVTSTLLVQTVVAIAGAVLLEAALSFLGLGTPLPAPSWGSMLSISKGYLSQAPWYGLFPGLAITLLVMGLYLLGNGLRDAFDPRRQKLK